MTKTYDTFGTVEGTNNIYATSQNAERVIIPSHYKGYDETDGESDSPRWLPIIEAAVGDSMITGDMGDITSGLSNSTITKEKAIKRVKNELDDVKTEKQAEALIDYLGSEAEISAVRSSENKHFEVDKDGISLFTNDLDKMAQERNADGIFNVGSVLSATIESLEDYLDEADDIADTMEDLTEEIDTERLFDAREKIENIERELEQLGEGSGYPDYENLTEAEQRQAEMLGEQYKMYNYINEVDLDFVDNICNFDYERYHEFLKDLKAFLGETNAGVQQMADQVRLNEEIDVDPVEIQKNLREGIASLRDEHGKMEVLEDTSSNYNNSGKEVLEVLSDASEENQQKGGDFSTDEFDGPTIEQGL